MAHAAGSAPRPWLEAVCRPWYLMVAGVALTFASLGLMYVAPAPVRVIAAGLGLLLAGQAVSRRLQTAEDYLEDRVESAGLLAVGAFAALLACLALQEWDSAQMGLGVLTAVALLGSVLVLMPSLVRKVILSLLVVLHFGCICTAVTLVPPRSEAAPWLSMELFARFYRPYMSFMYLNNAYHFYSPDPGPANLLWFHVEYSDGSARWLKLPYRADYKLNIHYQRMLALTEFASNAGPTPLSEEQIPFWEHRMGRHYEHDSWQSILYRRQLIEKQVPELKMVADLLPNVQYAEPSDESKHFIQSYARHVAMTMPHPTDPTATVKAVKIYRVVHNIIRPKELAEGHQPDEKPYYWPYYYGKFDPSGKLLDPQDPCLYWMLPITYVTPDYPEDKSPLRVNDPPHSSRLLDCVEIHANLRGLDD